MEPISIKTAPAIFKPFFNRADTKGNKNGLIDSELEAAGAYRSCKDVASCENLSQFLTSYGFTIFKLMDKLSQFKNDLEAALVIPDKKAKSRALIKIALDMIKSGKQKKEDILALLNYTLNLGENISLIEKIIKYVENNSGMHLVRDNERADDNIFSTSHLIENFQKYQLFFGGGIGNFNNGLEYFGFLGFRGKPSYDISLDTKISMGGGKAAYAQLDFQLKHALFNYFYDTTSTGSSSSIVCPQEYYYNCYSPTESRYSSGFHRSVQMNLGIGPAVNLFSEDSSGHAGFGGIASISFEFWDFMILSYEATLTSRTDKTIDWNSCFSLRLSVPPKQI